MEKLRNIILGIGSGIMLTACSPVKVISTQSAPGVELGTFKSFQFLEVSGPDSAAHNNSVSGQQLVHFKKAVTRELVKKGFTPTSASPDLLVNLGIMTQEKTQTRQTNFQTDAPYYTGQRRYSWQAKEIPVNTYKQGTISVQLIDRAKDELVWSGEAEAVIPAKEEKAEERIREGVEKLLERMLPQGNKNELERKNKAVI